MDLSKIVFYSREVVWSSLDFLSKRHYKKRIELKKGTFPPLSGMPGTTKLPPFLQDVSNIYTSLYKTYPDEALKCLSMEAQVAVHHYN